MRKPAALLFLGLVLSGVACDSSTTPSSTTPSNTGTSTESDDAAGESACSLFRDVAAGAFGESMSESEVASGLEEVGSVAQNSTTPAIKDNAQQVATEANARAMISGDANAAQDALAQACNDKYPI